MSFSQPAFSTQFLYGIISLLHIPIEARLVVRHSFVPWSIFSPIVLFIHSSIYISFFRPSVLSFIHVSASTLTHTLLTMHQVSWTHNRVFTLNMAYNRNSILGPQSRRNWSWKTQSRYGEMRTQRPLNSAMPFNQDRTRNLRSEGEMVIGLFEILQTAPIVLPEFGRADSQNNDPKPYPHVFPWVRDSRSLKRSGLAGGLHCVSVCVRVRHQADDCWTLSRSNPAGGISPKG